MKTVIVVLGLLGLAAPPAATDVAKEREEGFRPLVNGKDTTGWHLRNPQGQVTFRDGRVAPCAALGWTGGPEVSAAIRTVLERHGATRVVTDVAATSCPEGRRPYDVVAVERRLFQALPPEAVRSLVTDIAERRLTPLATVAGSDIAAAQERVRREREIAAGLRNGTMQGMGLLLLGGNTRRICARSRFNCMASGTSCVRPASARSSSASIRSSSASVIGR